MNKPVVSVRNLGKQYGRTWAAQGVSFEIGTGEIFALIGPNGAGKSTTLRTLATLLTPTEGTAEIFGHDLRTDPAAVRRSLSYLPEEAGAYKNMKGLDYLKFMARISVADPAAQAEAIRRGEALANLGDRIRDKASTYSKGMTRKLLLARTMMTRPKFAILDEPTSGLDITNAMAIRTTIRSLANDGMAVLLSSHNMLEIEFLSDRVGLIAQGKLLEIGTPAALKKKYDAKNLEEVFLAITKEA